MPIEKQIADLANTLDALAKLEDDYNLTPPRYPDPHTAKARLYRRAAEYLRRLLVELGAMTFEK